MYYNNFIIIIQVFFWTNGGYGIIPVSYTHLDVYKRQAYERFGFLLNAFQYGVPPHAGLAYGLDRLVMLMAKMDSIRDVIAFPKVKDASCLMTDAPNVVDEKQLDELALHIVEQEN